MIRSIEELILASGSETRKNMLEGLGLSFKAIKSDIDEEKLKASKPDLGPIELGMFLAKAKAKAVSLKYSNAFVIGADQVCELNGVVYDKPGSVEKCIEHLKALSAKEHSQNCCTCIYRDGKLLWEHSASAKIKLRDLSDLEIRAYVELEKPIHSAGSYMLEKHGKHLFAEIQGDHDVILGLPLVELLNKLYEFSVIELVDVD